MNYTKAGTLTLLLSLILMITLSTSITTLMHTTAEYEYIIDSHRSIINVTIYSILLTYTLGSILGIKGIINKNKQETR